MAPNPEKEQYSQREILRDIQATQKKQGEVLARLNGALIGDTELNVPGLFHRVHRIERHHENQKWWYTMIAALASGLAVGATKVYDFFTHKP